MRQPDLLGACRDELYPARMINQLMNENPQKEVHYSSEGFRFSEKSLMLISDNCR